MSHDREFFTTFVGVLVALAVLAVIFYFIAALLTKDMAEHKPEEVLLENIKPIGKVNIADESGAMAPAPATVPMPAPSPAASTQVAEAASGEQTYKTYCLACHSTGAAGAPKLGDAAAWAPRIAKGMDTLLASATKGMNAMPPKGLCMGCSDADLMASIEYIVDQSR